MKILAVGDVHAVEGELEDCNRLIDFVIETAHQIRADYVVFLGDQYHTHKILNVEVMAFWKVAFAKLCRGVGVVALVGNHSYAGEGATNHAMLAHTDQIRVVDGPQVIEGVLFLPYCSDRQALVDACKKYSECPTVICHQTFVGGEDAGVFFAKDGIDPTSIPQEQIISGHIHTPQLYGKVWYVGSPRWRILTDANIDRAIWSLEFKDGKLVESQSFSTGDVCKRVWHLIDTPEVPISRDFNAKDQYRVDIKGPPAYIEARKKELEYPGVRIRTFPTQVVNIEVRESEGIGVAFQKFFTRYEPRFGTSREVLDAMVKERLLAV